MAHWRAFFTSKDYLTAADLYDEGADRFVDRDVQITKVNRVTLKGERGREDQRPGIYFRGLTKPLGANATNCDSISIALGSYDMKQWPGGWLTLYVDENVEVKERGRTVKRPAVRIRMKSPRAAQGPQQGGQSGPAARGPQQDPRDARGQQQSRPSAPPASSPRQGPPPDLFSDAPPIGDDEAAEIARAERESAQRERR